MCRPDPWCQNMILHVRHVQAGPLPPCIWEKLARLRMGVVDAIWMFIVSTILGQNSPKWINVFRYLACLLFTVHLLVLVWEHIRLLWTVLHGLNFELHCDLKAATWDLVPRSTRPSNDSFWRSISRYYWKQSNIRSDDLNHKKFWPIWLIQQHQTSSSSSLFPVPHFVFVLFSDSLVLFRIADVDCWNKPSTAIFFSPFIATSWIALICLTSKLPWLSCFVVVEN